MSDVAFARKVAELFETHPDKWESDSYTVTFGRLRWGIWVTSGRGFVRVYRSGDGNVDLSNRARRIIWRAFRKWKAVTDQRRLVQLLADLTTELEREAA